jgi:hypothetical protein
MWLVKRWSSSFYIIRSALYGIVVLLDQNRLLAETFTRNAQLPPQQPRTSPCCVHTHKRLTRLLLILLWRSFFLIPTGSRNFWASLSTIVLQVGPAFLLCGLASFARPALVDFTIDNNWYRQGDYTKLFCGGGRCYLIFWGCEVHTEAGRRGLAGWQHANEEIPLLLFFYRTGSMQETSHSWIRAICLLLPVGYEATTITPR